MFIAAALSLPMAAFGRQYHYSVPMGGALTMSAKNLAATSGSSGAFNLNLTSMAGDVYLDRVNQTARQVETMAYTPSAASIVLHQTEQIGGQTVPGTLTIYLASSGGVLPFDTGIGAATWNAGSDGYAVTEFMSSLGSFSGSCSLVTGGQTYNGVFGYSLNAPNVPYGLADFISVSGYPNSVTFRGTAVSPA